jgi:hypothetical protein
MHSTSHYSTSQFVFTSRCQVTVPRYVDSSPTVFMTLLADDCLTTNSVLQLLILNLLLASLAINDYSLATNYY